MRAAFNSLILAEGDVTDFLNSRIIESIDKDEELGLGSFVENKSSSIAISESQNSQIEIDADVPVRLNQDIQSIPISDSDSVTSNSILYDADFENLVEESFAKIISNEIETVKFPHTYLFIKKPKIVA